MALTLYNTLTRRKEPFRPIDPKNVRMYVCGPTVYDDAHIGNARPVIVFDVLFRLLRHIHGPEHVTYARNITDVDDKINARAAEEGVPIRELTERTAKQFHDDIAALGVLPPTVEPRATEHIPEMRTLIETLVAKGNAYVADDHVLFDVGSMPDYGRLSNRSLTEMEAGARVDVAPYKRGPMDFVLWKPSKPSEPSWPSPAGITAPGRPGWHIECSAMAEKHLGRVFDIHGGGIDLVFPHHENEVAQSRCAHGTLVMANYWMHNGFLQVEGEKMSKSLGNFVTIRELLKEWPGEVLRLNMLRTHYRQPIDWTIAGLKESVSLIHEWRAIISEVRPGKIDDGFLATLRDDLNTPKALAELARLRSNAARGDLKAASSVVASLVFLGFFDIAKQQSTFEIQFANPRADLSLSAMLQLTFGETTVGQFLQLIDDQEASPTYKAALKAELREVNTTVTLDELKSRLPKCRQYAERIDARSAARKAKDFKEADRIRDELAAMGIQLKDAKDPATGEIATTWEVKR